MYFIYNTYNKYNVCAFTGSINCIMSIILHLTFSSTVFLRFVYVDAYQSNTFILTISQLYE